jgi:hypothetical protein
MSDNTIEMNPSDVIGAFQRGLHELQGHLNSTNALQVDVQAVVAHIERLMPFLAKLQQMQASMAAQQSATNGEARAN